MIGIGLFILNEDILLYNVEGGNFILVLKVMVLICLIFLDINIFVIIVMELLILNGRVIVL